LRVARAVISTVYSIFLAQFSEHLTSGAGASGGNIFKALPDAFVGIGFGGQLEEALIFGGVLEDDRGLALHGERNRALRCLDLLDQVGGLVEEGGKRLDFLGE
jgi:hypothetical protein